MTGYDMKRQSTPFDDENLHNVVTIYKRFLFNCRGGYHNKQQFNDSIKKGCFSIEEKKYEEGYFISLFC